MKVSLEVDFTMENLENILKDTVRIIVVGQIFIFLINLLIYLFLAV